MPRSIAHVPDVQALARRLRERRESLGLSQRQLAFPGCTAAYISRIEAGARTPSRQMIDELAARLETTRDWLETGTGPSDVSKPIDLSISATDVDAHLRRSSAGQVTWEGLSDEERGWVVTAMRDASGKAAEGMTSAIVANRQARQDAMARLDADLAEQATARFRETAEAVSC